MSDDTSGERYCTYCHTFGHLNQDCPDCPVTLITMTVFVPVYIENPIHHIRTNSVFPPDIDIVEMFQEDEPVYPNGADPELHTSWREMVEFWEGEGEGEEEGTPSMSYSGWIEDQIRTYEQIWRESARDRDRDNCESYLQVLRREQEKLPYPQE